MVKHRPITKTEVVCKHYSEKDGVPIKYVCTTSLTPRGMAYDVFFRETPHPKFGNRYFGLFFDLDERRITGNGARIVNADKVEDLSFDCIQGVDGWEYSSRVHDFKYVDDCFIDGGREYTRRGGDSIPQCKTFVVRDGNFIEKEES